MFPDKQISKLSKRTYKKIIKEKVRVAAFEDLVTRKDSHSKVRDISYKKFKIQQYLSSSKFTIKEKQLLFKLRTRMFDAKANFSSMYVNNDKCNFCESDKIQTQRHLLESCDKIISNSKIISENIEVDHDYIYGEENEQLEVTKMYMEIQQICEKLQNQSEDM